MKGLLLDLEKDKLKRSDRIEIARTKANAGLKGEGRRGGDWFGRSENTAKPISNPLLGS